MSRSSVPIVLLFLALAGSSYSQDCDVDELVSISPMSSANYAAVWVATPPDSAVVGIRWYNNDEGSVFPTVKVAVGVPNRPVDPSEALVAAVDLSGPSLGWQEVLFSGSYTSDTGGFYLLMQFPDGPEYTGRGAGGGAAVGYVSVECGSVGWIGGEDGCWTKIGGGVVLAVTPVLDVADDGSTAVKNSDEDDTKPPTMLALRPPSPNPFNPSVELSFSLPRDDEVSLDVFDVAGRHVRRLIQTSLRAGQHTCRWDGRSDSGESVSSGVYYARLRTNRESQTRKLTLIK